MSAEKQIDKLAKHILNYFNEDIVDGGAGDVAINILERLSSENKRYLEALEGIQDIQEWQRQDVDHEVLKIVKRAIEV